MPLPQTIEELVHQSGQGEPDEVYFENRWICVRIGFVVWKMKDWKSGEGMKQSEE